MQFPDASQTPALGALPGGLVLKRRPCRLRVTFIFLPPRFIPAQLTDSTMKKSFQAFKLTAVASSIFSLGAPAWAADACVYIGDHLVCGSATVLSTNFTTAVGSQNTVSGLFATAVGAVNQAGVNGTAVGSYNRAGETSTALGFENRALSGKESVAVGTENWVYGNRSSAFGFRNLIGDSTAPINNGVAIGEYNLVNADRSVMIGSLNANNAPSVASIIIGNQSRVGIRDSRDFPTEYAVAIGDKITVTGARGIAVGIESTVYGLASVAIGSNAIARGDLSVALGVESDDGGQNDVVSVGNSAYRRRIINVADGVDPNDAVTVRQLSAAYGNIQNQVDTLSKRAFYGTASVAAIAGIPSLQSDKMFNFGVGLGNYRGQSAIALGGHMRVNNSTVVKASFGFGSQGEATSSVGIGMSF